MLLVELFSIIDPQVVFMYMLSRETIVLNSVCSIESKHEVTILSGLNEFVVKFFGPQGSKCFSSLCVLRFMISCRILVGPFWTCVPES